MCYLPLKRYYYYYYYYQQRIQWVLQLDFIRLDDLWFTLLSEVF